MSKALPVLCGQLYAGVDMRVVPCSRRGCGNWDRGAERCIVETGAEHLPLATQIPECPISERCQHQIQAGSSPCTVRSRGLVCESAFVAGGMSAEKAADHPLAFHAHFYEEG